MRLSVVIPALNEANRIVGAIKSARAPGFDVVVADVDVRLLRLLFLSVGRFRSVISSTYRDDSTLHHVLDLDRGHLGASA